MHQEGEYKRIIRKGGRDKSRSLGGRQGHQSIALLRRTTSHILYNNCSTDLRANFMPPKEEGSAGVSM